MVFFCMYCFYAAFSSALWKFILDDSDNKIPFFPWEAILCSNRLLQLSLPYKQFKFVLLYFIKEHWLLALKSLVKPNLVKLGRR